MRTGDGVAGSASALRTGEARAQATSAVPCSARPGSGLVHLDGPCQCFFGGPPPEFLDDSTSGPVHRLR